MKIGWIASLAVIATTGAFAQTTIYKHVDESGHTTYSNKPMKGATVMELEPITLVPGLPAGAPAAVPVEPAVREDERPHDASEEAAETDSRRVGPVRIAR